MQSGMHLPTVKVHYMATSAQLDESHACSGTYGPGREVMLSRVTQQLKGHFPLFAKKKKKKGLHFACNMWFGIFYILEVSMMSQTLGLLPSWTLLFP